MAKVKLGTRPSDFKKIIEAKQLDGTTATVEVWYKYRTREEFGAFIDDLTAATKDTNSTDTGEKLPLKEIMRRARESNTDYILQVVEKWNLDIEFSRDAVGQLCDEYPATATAIMDTYRTAVTEGRLGN